MSKQRGRSLRELWRRAKVSMEDYVEALDARGGRDEDDDDDDDDEAPRRRRRGGRRDDDDE